MGLEHWQQMQPGNQQWKQIFMEVRLRWQWNYHALYLLPIFLSEYVGWSQKYLCREFREKMPKKFPVLLNMWTSGGFVAAEIRIEAIEQSKRDNQLESRNRFAMIWVIESMDRLILGIPSMVMAAT